MSSTLGLKALSGSGSPLRTQQVSPIAAAVFIICMLAGAGLAALTKEPLCMVGAALIGIYFLFAIKVADQWEKVAVLRLGRYRGLRGPGLFMIIPVVDMLSNFVDQRIRVTDVKAEQTLSRDAVPVYVDAIVFWVVWNAEKSILEVESFFEAVDPQRTDGAARIDRPAHAYRNAHRARIARAGASKDPGREDQPVGRHRTIRGNP